MLINNILKLMELVDLSHMGNVLEMKSTEKNFNLNTNVTFVRFTYRMSLNEQLLQFKFSLIL